MNKEEILKLQKEEHSKDGHSFITVDDDTGELTRLYIMIINRGFYTSEFNWKIVKATFQGEV